MTITNGYTTAEALKPYLSIDDTVDNSKIDQAINAASRAIDNWCGQRFWKDSSGTVRYLTATSASEVLLAKGASDVESQGIVSVTSLDLDTSGDGTYDTNWSEGTEFYLAPRGAATANRPYTEIRTLSGYSLPTGRERVKVTGVFGWPAVPDEVTDACILVAQKLFKHATEGAAPIVTMNGTTLPSSRYLDGTAQMLLLPFRRPVVL